MNDSHLGPAEATDRHGRLCALGLGIGAVLFAANAAERVAGDQFERALDIGQITLAGVMVLVLIPALRWKFAVHPSLSEDDGRQYFAADSYMVHTLKKARTLSWLFTFVSLVALGVASRALPDVPAKFFLDAALAVMFGVFAATVLVLNR